MPRWELNIKEKSMNKPLFVLLVLIISISNACSSGNSGVFQEEDSREKVVLAFDFRDVLEVLESSNISNEESIGRISILIFNSITAEKVYAESFKANRTHQIKISPGIYDFYFIANEEFVLAVGLTQDDLDIRIKTKINFTNYDGASEFPMARVYKSQEVRQGGTIMRPQQFIPQPPSVNPLSPISAFGRDKVEREQISLVRAIAKISVVLEGEGALHVQKLEYVNAVADYSLGQLVDGDFSTPVIDNILFEKSNVNDLNNYLPVYIPERLFSKEESKGWLRDMKNELDEPVGAVNYLQVTMRNGEIYKIPVIANADEVKGNYLDIARDSQRADYNVIRNYDYQFRIKIPLSNRELQVGLVVAPWNSVDSEMSFTKPEIDFNFSGVQIEDEILLIDGQNSIDFTLRVKNSNGEIWRVVLSNGLDFQLVPSKTNADAIPAVQGVASSQTTYGFSLVPLKPYQGTPRFTELYLLVSGSEVSLLNDKSEVGPGNRFLMKQVQIN